MIIKYLLIIPTIILIVLTVIKIVKEAVCGNHEEAQHWFIFLAIVIAIFCLLTSIIQMTGF